MTTRAQKRKQKEHFNATIGFFGIMMKKNIKIITFLFILFLFILHLILDFNNLSRIKVIAYNPIIYSIRGITENLSIALENDSYLEESINNALTYTSMLKNDISSLNIELDLEKSSHVIEELGLYLDSIASNMSTFQMEYSRLNSIRMILEEFWTEFISIDYSVNNYKKYNDSFFYDKFLSLIYGIEKILVMTTTSSGGLHLTL